MLFCSSSEAPSVDAHWRHASSKVFAGISPLGRKTGVFPSRVCQGRFLLAAARLVELPQHAIAHDFALELNRPPGEIRHQFPEQLHRDRRPRILAALETYQVDLEN